MLECSASNVKHGDSDNVRKNLMVKGEESNLKVKIKIDLNSSYKYHIYPRITRIFFIKKHVKRRVQTCTDRLNT